jgi:hypothetical protein
MPYFTSRMKDYVIFFVPRRARQRTHRATSVLICIWDTPSKKRNVRVHMRRVCFCSHAGARAILPLLICYAHLALRICLKEEW